MNQIVYVNNKQERSLKETAKAAQYAGLTVSYGFPDSVLNHVPGKKPQGVLAC